MPSSRRASLADLSAKLRDVDLRVIVQTPKGSRNQYAFDRKHNVFQLKNVLPIGLTFPFDVGFIPSTAGADRDPLDVVVLLDEPAFAGCVLSCRLIGVVQAILQGPKRKATVNRLVAIESHNQTYAAVKHLDDLGAPFVEHLETFFKAYYALDDVTFAVKGVGGSDKAVRLVRRGLDRW